jgi:hypothetical protein
MNKPESPQVLAVVPLPSAEERRRREVMLARVMLVPVDAEYRNANGTAGFVRANHPIAPQATGNGQTLL